MATGITCPATHSTATRPAFPMVRHREAAARPADRRRPRAGSAFAGGGAVVGRSEEHTSELQSLMRISYAVFCLKKKSKTLNQLILLWRSDDYHLDVIPSNNR